MTSPDSSPAKSISVISFHIISNTILIQEMPHHLMLGSVFILRMIFLYVLNFYLLKIFFGNY